MSKYTTTLYELIENGYTFSLSDYPIFDESYREKLNKKIIDHYFFYEIGFNTFAEFNHYLRTTLNEIMPYYNQLYASELISISPLIKKISKQVYEKTAKGKSDGKQSMENISNSSSKGDSTSNGNIISDSNSTGSNNDITTNNSHNKGRTVSSDTPDGKIKLNTAFDAELYASSVGLSEDNNDGNSNTKNTSTGSDKSTQNSINSGKSTASNDSKNNSSGLNNASFDNIDNYVDSVESNSDIHESEQLKLFRSSFLNIDLQIINELHDLFMLIY